jgi:hypothetical protein
MRSLPINIMAEFLEERFVTLSTINGLISSQHGASKQGLSISHLFEKSLA